MSESKLLGLQSGFRSGTNYDVAFPPRCSQNTETLSDYCFLLLWIAFDSVSRRTILIVHRHYGVPDPVVADVMQLYHGSSTAVSTSFRLTEMFDTTSGVLQGDTLSRHVFILLVDYILRQSPVDEDGFTLKPANSHRHPSITLTSLTYADDVAITSDSVSDAEINLHQLQFYSEAVGLKLNKAKTNVLHVGYESDPKPNLTLDGMKIDVCDTYNYLGLPTLL